MLLINYKVIYLKHLFITQIKYLIIIIRWSPNYLAWPNWLLPICSVSISHSFLIFFAAILFHTFLLLPIFCLQNYPPVLCPMSEHYFCPLNSASFLPFGTLNTTLSPCITSILLSSLPRKTVSWKQIFWRKITTQTNNRHGNSPQRYGNLSLPVEQFIEKTLIILFTN